MGVSMIFTPILSSCVFGMSSCVREGVRVVSKFKISNEASYEFFLILSSKIGEDGSLAVVDKFKELIEKHGELGTVDRWGKRKFAYPIKKEAEGEYVLFKFKSKTDFPPELDRVSRITDEVLRSLIVRKNKVVSEAQKAGTEQVKEANAVESIKEAE